MIRDTEGLDALEQRVGIFGRQRPVAGDRGVKIGIRHFQEPFELPQLVVAEVSDFRIRKAAEDEVKLAGAAMPAAKQQPLAAVIEPVARSCRSSHSQFQSNAKSPDVPGGLDIAMPGADVSPLDCVSYQLCRHCQA